MDVLKRTDFPELKFFKRGKVRDIYEIEDKLLIISTDRISCFDVVLPTCIPYKGKVLNQLSLFWFDFTKEIIPNHLITANVENYPSSAQKYREILRDRSMLVKKVKPIPVECIVRGYLSGSAWKDYQKNRSICRIELPRGLRESEKLPQPIFTPATKKEVGHDVNISQEELEKEIGKEMAEKIKKISLLLYEKASEYAESKGIIIADTKFEFGISDGEIILIDEILTPDSSRFWPKDEYQPGRPQPSLDKQFVRDYLESINWDKKSSPPKLPNEIVKKTSEKYLQVLKILVPQKVSLANV